MNVQKILVVEDDFVHQMLVSLFVQSISDQVQIEWAANLEQAKASLAHHKFTMVLSDYNLGQETTGLDLYKFCLKEYPHIPFFLMSGMENDQLEALTRANRQMPVYLPKNIDVGKWEAAIKSVIFGKAAA